MQLHLVESADAAAQLFVLPNLPSDKQRVEVIGEWRDQRGLEVEEVAVEDIETEVAHLRLDDPVSMVRGCDTVVVAG